MKTLLTILTPRLPMGLAGITLSAVTILKLSAPQPVAAVILLPDNFDTENGGVGILNYVGLANWNVTEGTVDLIGNGLFDFLPGNGLYLDLDGSTGNAGRIESKTTYSFNPADIVELQFKLAGSQRGDTNSVTVSLGSLFSEIFTLNSSEPFTTITRNFTVASPANGKLVFDHAGGDWHGLLLDQVKISVNQTISIPEPSSTSVIFALGFLGAGSCLKQKLSQSKQSNQDED
jgi:hypothetical protein